MNTWKIFVLKLIKVVIFILLSYHTQNPYCYLKLNEDKCKLIILSKQENNSTLSLGNEVITSSRSEKLLGITIDHKLTFNEHVENLCIKAKITRLSSDI